MSYNKLYSFIPNIFSSVICINSKDNGDSKDSKDINFNSMQSTGWPGFTSPTGFSWISLAFCLARPTRKISMRCR